MREVGGSGTESTLQLKQKSTRNEIVAPRIVAFTSFRQTGETFNPLNDIPMISPEQAITWVRANAKKGADGIKFFGASPEIMTAALD